MIGRGGRWNELLAGGPHAPIAPLSAAMTQIAYIMRWICGRATASAPAHILFSSHWRVGLQ